MASTSAPRNSAAFGRIPSAAATLFSDGQTLIAVSLSLNCISPNDFRYQICFIWIRIYYGSQEIRKATMMMKEIAVLFEEENKSDLVFLVPKP